MLKRILVFVLDLVIFIVGGLILYTLLTGGGVYHIRNVRIIAYKYTNGLYGLIPLAIIRVLISRAIPLLAIPKLRLDRVAEKARRLCVKLLHRLNSLDEKRAHRLILAIVVLSLTIKLANAWYYYGFVTGDDVEIQEMSFAKLFQWDWTAWNLRNAFYAMVFIYPAQAVLNTMGIEDPSLLIFSGRVVVALFSCLNLWMVFKIGKLEFSKLPIGLLACFFLAISKLHTNYGSSELPRTVSSFFLLLAVLWVIQKNLKLRGLVLAGVALGVSSAIRFSEVIFLIPLVLLIWKRQKFQSALIFTVIFAASSMFIIGLSDMLYWKKPFYSLINIVDFTFVKRLSSRGYQPFYHYVTIIPDWTNGAFLLLLLVSLRSIPIDLLNLIWIPLVLLSFLPHKEARYALPVIPFLAICLGAAFWDLLSKVNLQVRNGFGHVSPLAKPLVLVFLMTVGILFELDGFRFRRSEDAVDLARFLNSKDGVSAVAIQQLWKTGDRLYMNHIESIDDISPAYIGDFQYIREKIQSPKLQFVALQKRDLKRYGYLSLLRESGYQEVTFPTNWERNQYRLFQHNRK